MALPEGNRIAFTTTEGTTKLAVDPHGALSRVLVRERPDGTKTFYVYGLTLLYEVDESEAIRTYHFNQVGSTVALVAADGLTVTGRLEYSPYGQILTRTGNTDTPFLYNGVYGVQTDPNGLLSMRARYYNPHLRRFLNADPIGFDGGLNWYAFANGNPVKYLDPFGLYPGQYIVDYWHNAIVNPANGTVGGLVIAGIEGASSGAGAWFDGFLPVVSPFSGNYTEGDLTTDTIRMVGAGTREGLIAAGGAAFAGRVVAASGAEAVATYNSFNFAQRTFANRLIVSQAFSAPGALGQVQTGAMLTMQGVSFVDGLHTAWNYFDRVQDHFVSQGSFNFQTGGISSGKPQRW